MQPNSMATFWSRCACISIETVLTYPSCQLLVLAAKMSSPVDGDLGESLLIYEKQHELRLETIIKLSNSNHVLAWQEYNCLPVNCTRGTKLAEAPVHLQLTGQLRILTTLVKPGPGISTWNTQIKILLSRKRLRNVPLKMKLSLARGELWLWQLPLLLR